MKINLMPLSRIQEENVIYDCLFYHVNTCCFRWVDGLAKLLLSSSKVTPQSLQSLTVEARLVATLLNTATSLSWSLYSGPKKKLSQSFCYLLSKNPTSVNKAIFLWPFGGQINGVPLYSAIPVFIPKPWSELRIVRTRLSFSRFVR